MDKQTITMKQLINVLIIDDSLIYRSVLSNAVNSDSSLKLIGAAADPFQATQIINNVLPDVITLDLHMPGMNGFTFLKKLMAQYPIPVIIFSSITKGNRELCMKAFELGALEVIDKSLNFNSDQDIAEFNQMLCEKIKDAAKAKVFKKKYNVAPTPTPPLPKIKSAEQISISKANISNSGIIAIGASAGGTQAIEYILRRLPKNMPGILIVQHMPEGFTKLFADRLNTISELEVREAEDNEIVTSGKVLIAPGNYQMELVGSKGNYSVKVFDGPPVNRHKPAVDVLFDSFAKNAKSNGLGVILTGMGSDGAKGLLAMKEAGAYTISQDKESSVVFGMPQQAIKLGGAQAVLSLEQIPEFLIDFYKS